MHAWSKIHPQSQKALPGAFLVFHFWLFYEQDIVRDMIHMQRKCDSTVTETKPKANPLYSKLCLLFHLPDAWNSSFEASRDTEKCLICFLEKEHVDMNYSLSVPKQSFLCHNNKGDILAVDSTVYVKFRKDTMLMLEERWTTLPKDFVQFYICKQSMSLLYFHQVCL